ncbi:MAG: tryptophan--tRNA ligase [Clostridiales bacterium]|jgi:tryptophanyl-tRNA synthetase|nr:tryptophan--tRNA ligase [Clostridiales bacterium]
MLKRCVFSAIQPTGIPTLGNYGVLKKWVDLQNDYNCVFMVADLHSLTSKQDPDVLKKNSLDLFALLISIGLDPNKSIIYFQSHISQHAELTWILNCYTGIGELFRMTQFKEKSKKNKKNINSGLLVYPVLMAADILLFDANLVPVGKDQKQHIEFCRDIAIRFNKIFGPCFEVPNELIQIVGEKIMSLQEPNKKMSKSDPNLNSTIFLLDSERDIIKKIKRAVTDSENIIKFAENKLGINNLLNIFCSIKNVSLNYAEFFFRDKNYSDLKNILAEEISINFNIIQEKYNKIRSDEDKLYQVINLGCKKAKLIAEKKIKKIKKTIGFA